jgi:hypothetical protein
MNRNTFLKHTYIVGGGGSGKSELIRTIVDTLGGDTIIIDPHGTLAKETGKTGLNIEPRAHRFVVNPFDIQDKSEFSRQTTAQEITDLMEEMIRDVGLSSLMETVAYPVIYTLLKLPYADFKMFADCINPNKGKARLRSIRHLVEPLHFEIWDELEGDTYDTSRQSLFNRLQGFLNKGTIFQTVTGRDDFTSLLDLEKGLNGKSISINLAGVGSDISEVLGRMFMTRLQIWARHREEIPPERLRPVFLIVDEFQNFVGQHLADTLDQYGRKFKLFVILAHQHVGQVSSELRGSIMANMKNKIGGASDHATRMKLQQEMGVGVEEFDKLRVGTFYARHNNEPAYRFESRMLPPLREQQRTYCQTQNSAEMIDGWDGLDVEQDHHDTPTRHKNTRSKAPGIDQAQTTTVKQKKPNPPKGGFTPRFDI